MSTFDRLALLGVSLLIGIPMLLLFLSWKYADLAIAIVILAAVFTMCVIIPIAWLVTA